jgi:hypothetical protein
MIPIPWTSELPEWAVASLAALSDVMLYVKAVWCLWALVGLWRAVASERRALARDRARRISERLAMALNKSPRRQAVSRALIIRTLKLQMVASKLKIGILRCLIGVQAIFLLTGIASLYAPDPVRPQMTLAIVISTAGFMTAGYLTNRMCSLIDWADVQSLVIVADYRATMLRGRGTEPGPTVETVD